MHADYVIILAFARQQWVRECASVLRLYVGLHCLSCFRIRSKDTSGFSIESPMPEKWTKDWNVNSRAARIRTDYR